VARDGSRLEILCHDVEDASLDRAERLAGRNPFAQSCAALEALEEAGVSGALSDKPVGAFRYFKRCKDGEVVSLPRHVFALEVREQRRFWAEKDSRDFRWCSIEHALALVGEPGLRQVIARFAETMRVEVD